ncbi:Josephin-2 [Gonapodya sp. JEL0774]|nr:Josephin-2 [Gonapodya sp. JEL0774]
MHAVNSAFQKRIYYKRDFDKVANQLHKETRKVQTFPWNLVNPHKSLLGVGNYDVNVISRSFEEHGFELQWWDLRKPLAAIPFESPSFLSLLLNATSGDLLSSHHFWTIREYPRASGTWWSLDSKQDRPDKIGPLAEVIKLLELLKGAKRELQVMVVVAKPVATEGADAPGENEVSPAQPTTNGDGCVNGALSRPSADEVGRKVQLPKQHPLPFELVMERRVMAHANMAVNGRS